MVVTSRVAIVYNSDAGRRGSRAAAKKAQRYFSKRANLLGVFDLHSTPAEALGALRLDTVCVIGGDGTLRRVLTILQRAGQQVPILLLPRGTANLIAKTLRMPHDIRDAFSLFEKGKTRTIDIARVDADAFFVGAFALGYLSDRVTGTHTTHKRRLGMFGYTLSFLRQQRLPLHHFTATVDGETIQAEGHSLFIVNTADIFGFANRRAVTCEDGFFELVVVTNRRFFGLFHVLLDFYLRRSHPKHFLLRRGTQFTVSASGVQSVQLDGDPIEYREQDAITVLPKQQAFYAP